MILNGEKLSQKILRDLKKKVKGRQLKLAVVLVGNNFASRTYVKRKRQACKETGIGFELFKLNSKISQKKLEQEVARIGQRADINGIVVQLPLPLNINADRVLGKIPLDKDVEGFVSNRMSPVVCAIEHILKEHKISLEDKKVVVLGQGRLVGRPVAEWLKKEGIEFSGMDKLKQADVVISGLAKPHIIKKDMVKRGVVIIDVATCRIKGKTVGDADFDDLKQKADLISPPVGGLGPVTVACLLRSIVYG